MKHRLKHFLGWHSGHVVSVKVDEVAWIGFQCEECGDITSLCEPMGSNWNVSEQRPSYVKEKR